MIKINELEKLDIKLAKIEENNFLDFLIFSLIIKHNKEYLLDTPSFLVLLKNTLTFLIETIYKNINDKNLLYDYSFVTYYIIEKINLAELISNNSYMNKFKKYSNIYQLLAKIRKYFIIKGIFIEKYLIV